MTFGVRAGRRPDRARLPGGEGSVVVQGHVMRRRDHHRQVVLRHPVVSYAPPPKRHDLGLQLGVVRLHDPAFTPFIRRSPLPLVGVMTETTGGLQQDMKLGFDVAPHVSNLAAEADRK